MRLRRAGSDPETVEKVYDDIDASIDQALKEIRAFTYLLYPQNLLTDGLKSTVEQYVAGFSLRTSLRCTLAIAPEIDRLSYEAQRALLRIIQEALSNVFRHAKATQVGITVEASEAHVRLRVSDDGCGMPFGGVRWGLEAASFGVGIPGMRTRVRQLGGRFAIEPSSAAEGGTTICAVIPYALRRNGARASGEHHSSRH
jgi:two-component system, NarL family, sensor kinase